MLNNQGLFADTWLLAVEQVMRTKIEEALV